MSDKFRLIVSIDDGQHFGRSSITLPIEFISEFDDDREKWLKMFGYPAIVAALQSMRKQSDTTDGQAGPCVRSLGGT